MNRYLIVSDLHLADIEDHEDGWKFFKGSRYVFDEDFGDLLKRFADRGEGPGTLVFNGDVFDFDLVTAVPEDPPWPVSRGERRRGLRASAGKSAWKLERILAAHPVFVDALARFLGRGHRVVYVLGNHDRELHFPEVREVFLESLRAAGSMAGCSFDDYALRFEPWFFHVPGRLYAEHGHQYDYYTSFRHLLEPTVERRGEREIALPMGNISNRLLMSRMGYFNPHASDYILNMFRYAVHWLRFYAFSRHSLMITWLMGSFLALRQLLDTKRRLRRRPPRGHEEALGALRARVELSGEDLDALRRLQRPPITDRLFRMVREFWIDRVVLSLLMTGGTIALALVPIPLWIKLMVPLSCFPLVYFFYEALAQGETVFSATAKVEGYAREIGARLRVPLVTFGHSHDPRLVNVGPGISFVDTGTWAPVTASYPRTELLPGYCNWLEVDFSEAEPRLTFDCRLGPVARFEDPTAPDPLRT